MIAQFQETLARSMALSSKKEEYGREITELLSEAERVVRKSFRNKSSLHESCIGLALTLQSQIGHLLGMLGEVGRAESLLKAALSAAKDFEPERVVEITMELADVYGRKGGGESLDDAVAVLKQCLEKSELLSFDNYALICTKISLFLLTNSKFEEAIAFRTKATRDVPKLREPLTARMKARLFQASAIFFESLGKGLKDPEASQEYMDRAFEYNEMYLRESQRPGVKATPEDEVLMLRRKAESQLRDGKRIQAIKTLKEALAVIPEHWCSGAQDIIQWPVFENLLQLLRGVEGTVAYELLQSIEPRAKAIYERIEKIKGHTLEEVKQERREVYEKKKSKKGGGKTRKSKKKASKKNSSKNAAAPLSTADTEKEKAEGSGVVEIVPDHQVEGDEGEGAAPEEGEEQECAICLFDLEEEEEEEEETTASLSCAHKFHKECLQSWFNRCLDKGWPRTCPYCRSEEDQLLFSY